LPRRVIVARQSDGQPLQHADPASEPLDARQQAFNNALLGEGLNAKAARKLLDARLTEKLAFVDRICRLTSAQTQRLHLAGRGDIKRFFDRIDSLRSTFPERPEGENDRAWADGHKVEAREFRRALNSGVFLDGSLFARILRTTLTADQLAAWDKAPPMPPAVGVIRWIDPTAKRVWIALDAGDGVKPGTTYVIRQKPRPQQNADKPDAASDRDAIDGTIEVTRVVGENLSEARILDEDVLHPIAKGDAVVPQRSGVR
jgi:hypothetical protein